MITATWTPKRADSLPAWACTELADRDIPLNNVTHWIGSRDGRTIAVVVNDKPTYLTKRPKE